MIWVTTVREFQAACRAGLVLDGPDEYCNPQWIGTKDKWATYNLLMEAE